jgi:DNA-binding winged helix-turn-helix (wHTH) protein
VQGLFRGAQTVHVTPKSLALLLALVEHAGQVVTKDELLQKVWPDVVVTEASLSTCIQELRTVLGDDARRPRFIETVHRRGYRFIGRTGAGDASEPRSSFAMAPQPVAIVGREPALEQLMSAFAHVRAGVRQIVFVSGEAGIGKTALAETFIENLPIEASARIARGDCVERYGAGEAYQPLLEALTRLCMQPGSTPLVATLRKFAPTWLAQLPGLHTSAEQRTLQRRTAGVTPARMLRELTDAFEAMAVQAPIVLFLDDLHWSDVSTLDWLSNFARRRERACVLVIAT